MTEPRSLPDQPRRRVLKWTISGPEIMLPLGDTDEILSAGMQDDQIVVWALRDEANRVGRGRRVVCVNTGDDVDHLMIRRGIGTVTSSNGIVWHVLEVAGP